MDKQTKSEPDPEVVDFEDALLRSLEQAARGEGRGTTPDQILARHKLASSE